MGFFDIFKENDDLNTTEPKEECHICSVSTEPKYNNQTYKGWQDHFSTYKGWRKWGEEHNNDLEVHDLKSKYDKLVNDFVNLNDDFSAEYVFNNEVFEICFLCKISLDRIYGDDKWFKRADIPFDPSDLIGKIKEDILDINTLRLNVADQTKIINKTKEKLIDSRKEIVSSLTDKTEEYRSLKKTEIIQLLKEKAVKMPTSDINAYLKHKNLDEIKELCEELYTAGEISFAGNGRYFIIDEEKKEPKKASAPKSEKVDVKAELKKYKEMLDDGLIEQEDYDAKKKELLGL